MQSVLIVRNAPCLIHVTRETNSNRTAGATGQSRGYVPSLSVCIPSNPKRAGKYQCTSCPLWRLHAVYGDTPVRTYDRADDYDYEAPC